MNPTHAIVRIEQIGSRFYLRGAYNTPLLLAGQLVEDDKGKHKYFTKRGAASTYAAARGWQVMLTDLEERRADPGQIFDVLKMRAIEDEPDTSTPNGGIVDVLIHAVEWIRRKLKR